jgi:hypothetical protein
MIETICLVVIVIGVPYLTYWLSSRMLEHFDKKPPAICEAELVYRQEGDVIRHYTFEE